MEPIDEKIEIGSYQYFMELNRRIKALEELTQNLIRVCEAQNGFIQELQKKSRKSVTIPTSKYEPSAYDYDLLKKLAEEEKRRKELMHKITTKKSSSEMMEPHELDPFAKKEWDEPQKTPQTALDQYFKMFGWKK